MLGLRTKTMIGAIGGLAAGMFVAFAPAVRADTLADIQKRGQINICNGILGLRPYLFKTADGSYSGFEYEMMTYVMKKLDVPKINFVFLDWAALIPGLKSGRCDIIWSGMTMTEERRTEGGIEFTRPYFFEDDHVVVLQDSPIKTLDGLKGKTIGDPVGSVEETQARSLIRQGYGSEFKGFNDWKTPFLALENKQVDAVVSDVFSFEGQKEITPNIRMLEGVALKLAADPKWQAAQDKAPYIMGGTGVAVRKDDATLVSALNKALNDMDADGTRKAILTKYNAWSDAQTMDNMMRH